MTDWRASCQCWDVSTEEVILTGINNSIAKWRLSARQPEASTIGSQLLDETAPMAAKPWQHSHEPPYRRERHLSHWWCIQWKQGRVQGKQPRKYYAWSQNDTTKNTRDPPTSGQQNNADCTALPMLAKWFSDLVHSTGQDLLPRGKGHNRTPRSLTRCPTSPTPHLYAKDSHSTGITQLLYE